MLMSFLSEGSKNMPYIKPEVIIKVKEIDLLTYLKNYEPYELVQLSEKTYTTKSHGSLKISNGKWMWWSQGIGGKNALDYLIKVKGFPFLNAVEQLIGYTAIQKPVYQNVDVKSRDRPLLLPEKSKSSDVVRKYLFNRGIDLEIINYCISKGYIYESMPYHNVVFVGFDDNNAARYAAYRSTNNSRIMGDCTGSKKVYSFRLLSSESNEVHIFECAIDLLSYATLTKLSGRDWRKLNLISLSGVYSPAKKIEESKIPIAIKEYLNKNKQISKIFLHLDNDYAGRNAALALKLALSVKYKVIDMPPERGKDFNDFLCIHRQINNKKCKRSIER